MAKFKPGDIIQSGFSIFNGPFLVISVESQNYSYVMQHMSDNARYDSFSIPYIDQYFMLDEEKTKRMKFKRDMGDILDEV